MSKKGDNKVTSLNNQYTQKKNAEKKAFEQKNTFKRRRIILIFAAAMIFFTLPSIRLYESYNELMNAQAEQERAKENRTQLEAQEKALQKQVNLLNDDQYVLKVARDRYSYSLEGETIFVIPDAPFRNVTANPPNQDEEDAQNNTGND